MSPDVAAAERPINQRVDRTASTGPRKGSMAPPSLPSGSSPAPRLVRLPSLQQISDRLHIPIPLSTQNPSSSNIDPSRISSPTSPIKRRVSINTANLSPTLSPYTASPSGRLKLPASAMMRSQSASSGIALRREGAIVDAEPFGPSSSGEPNVGRSESMSRGTSRDVFIKGYRDVPSLSAIRARMGSLKPQSTEEEAGVSPSPVDADPPAGRAHPALEVKCPAPEPSPLAVSESSVTSNEPATGKRREHPLRHSWTLYFDAKGLKPDPSYVEAREGQMLSDWEKTLVTVGRFDTVEGFARHLNNVRLPSALARNSNYHLFKNGIRPMWEDPANANGGKWVILFRAAPQLLDIAWANITMSLVGEILDPEDKVCGVVASSRPKMDRIQVWTRQKDDPEGNNLIGRRILESMALEGRESESMSMEFQYNSGDSHPPPGMFLHVPFSNPSASFAHAPPTPSRLSVTETGAGADRRGPTHPTLPATPIIFEPRDPSAQGRDGRVGPKSLPVQRSASSSNAFLSPMGGFGGTSPKTQHA